MPHRRWGVDLWVMNQKRLTHTSSHFVSSAFSLSVHVDAVSIRFRKSERKNVHTFFCLISWLPWLLDKLMYSLAQRSLISLKNKLTVFSVKSNKVYPHLPVTSLEQTKASTLKNIAGNIVKRHASLFQRFNFSFNIGKWEMCIRSSLLIYFLFKQMGKSRTVMASSLKLCKLYVYVVGTENTLLSIIIYLAD